MMSNKAPITADFAIQGGTIITMDPKRRVLSDSAIAVKDSRIVWMGPAASLTQEVSTHNIHNADGGVLCPGFINAHVHTTGDPLTRHYTPDIIGGADSLFTWVIPRYHAHEPEDEGLSAKLCAIELMKSGTTTFVEAGTIRHLDHAVEGFRQAGIRGRVGAWVEGRAHDGDKAAEKTLIDEAIHILEEEIERYPDHQDQNIAAWPILVGHNTNPDEVWRAAKTIADEKKLSVLAHMSPYQSDPDWFIAETKRRPVEHLAHIGVLGKNVLLTHMTHIDEREADIVADTGMGVVYCPFAALKGAFGTSKLARYPDMMRKGVPIAFATDGYDPEILAAARIGAAFFKDLDQDTATVSAMGALEFITCGAAEAIGMDHEIGSLEIGKKADILHFDTNNFQWRPFLAPVAQLAWSADARSLKDVWVNGRLVVKDGVSQTVNEEALLFEAQTAGERILKKAGLPELT